MHEIQEATAIYIAKDGKNKEVVLIGRNLWALRELIKAGKSGCTPIDNPAPRWSAYVHNLRKLGINIETIRLPHGGAFPGSHGKYVLHTVIRLISNGGGSA